MNDDHWQPKSSGNSPGALKPRPDLQVEERSLQTFVSGLAKLLLLKPFYLQSKSGTQSSFGSWALVWESDGEEATSKTTCFLSAFILGFLRPNLQVTFISVIRTSGCLTQTRLWLWSMGQIGCSPTPAPPSPPLASQRAGEIWVVIKGWVSPIVAKSLTGTLQPNKIFSESDTNLNKEDIA